MLQAFKQIQILENRLVKQVNDNIIKDYRISLKTDMRVELYILTSNESIDLSLFKKNNLNGELRFNDIEVITVTQREKNYDPLFNHIFSDKYPSKNSKVDVGLVWRFDTLLSNNIRPEKIQNPCNIVTFYSYKGGMGRTTSLCSYAIHLAQKGKKVVVIDCDFEAPGFLNFFNANKEQGQKSGLIEYLLDRDFVGKENINLEEDYLIEVDSDYCDNNGKIYVLPAGNLSYSNVEQSEDNVLDNNNLKINLYHYIHGLARLNISNTDNMLIQFRELFVDLKETLKLSDDDYILIDSRTGFNEIFGITALNLADVIVGFFGSSEQTRAGLYFLLDKYQGLVEQPKLMLINSIIPNNEKEAGIFTDSFNRLINTYKTYSDSEWDILGSVPLLSLHENKVLKQIGVQFFEQEELNENKEKELLNLIKTKKFNDYNEIEQAFEDLDKIFRQVDFFTVGETIEDYSLNKLEDKDLRDIILRHLNELLGQEEESGLKKLKLWAELGEIEPKTFFYRECMKTLFKKDKFIIQGFKGSGKTYIYKSLQKKEITDIILEKSELQEGHYEFVDIIALSKAKNNLKEFPFDKEEVKNIKNVRNFWKVYLWTSVMLDIKDKSAFTEFRTLYPSNLEQDINELSNLKGQNRKNFFSLYLNDIIKIAEIDNDLANLNTFLETKHINLFVLFDRLDGVANSTEWKSLITPLVDFWTDNIHKDDFSHFFPKIFLRNDILDGHIRTNNPRSIKNEYAFSIDWSKNEMYAYFFQLVFSDSKSKKAFFQTMRNYKEANGNLIIEIGKDIQSNNQLSLKEDYIIPLLNVFFGNAIKSPSRQSLGSPYTFFFLNFSNADSSISIRPFINLISGAVALALEDNDVKELSKPILHYVYTTDSDVRDNATQLHFEDLTIEAGHELKIIFDFIKYGIKKGEKLKSVVITFEEMNELLDRVMRSDEYVSMNNHIKDRNELKEILRINGIVSKDDRHKVFRFAQMYKYWLGLTSRQEDSIRVGQKIKNRVVKLDEYKYFGFVSTGYKSPNLYFSKNNFMGNINDLRINDLVEFTVEKNEKGLYAADIRKLRE